MPTLAQSLQSIHIGVPVSAGKLTMFPLLRADAGRADQVGAVFAIDGKLAGAELFDAAETLAKLLAKLVDSYTFDAIELDESQAASAVPSVDEVRQLLDRIAQAPASAYAAIAKGTDVRVDSAGLYAAALLDGERTVHLSAFAQP